MSDSGLLVAGLGAPEVAGLGAPAVEVVRGSASVRNEVHVQDVLAVSLFRQRAVVVVAEDAARSRPVLPSARTHDDPVHEERSELFVLVQKLRELLVPVFTAKMSAAGPPRLSCL